jgi:hypothetical protein
MIWFNRPLAGPLPWCADELIVSAAHATAATLIAHTIRLHGVFESQAMALMTVLLGRKTSAGRTSIAE